MLLDSREYQSQSSSMVLLVSPILYFQIWLFDGFPLDRMSLDTLVIRAFMDILYFPMFTDVVGGISDGPSFAGLCFYKHYFICIENSSFQVIIRKVDHLGRLTDLLSVPTVARWVFLWQHVARRETAMEVLTMVEGVPLYSPCYDDTYPTIEALNSSWKKFAKNNT